MPAALSGTVTELETSVAGACANRIVSVLAALSITEFPTTKIHIRAFSWDKNLTPPFIIVRPAPEVHNKTEGAIGKSVVHYRYMLTVAQVGNRDLIEGVADQLLWRELISRAFRKTRAFDGLDALPNSAQLRDTNVLPGEPFIQDAALINHNAQFILVDAAVIENVT